jgi:Pectinacetylesterase
MCRRPSRLVRLATPLLLLGALLSAACGTADPAPPPAPSGPITAAPETWTWVAFAGSACGNGSSTGLGVNLTSHSRDVVVYFQGGGACWDAFTCIRLRTADNLETGYGPVQFAVEAMLTAAPFDRGNAGNPFKDASFVFIPYCTGDLHDGTVVNDYGGTRVHHVGGLNTGLFLERLAATFPGGRRVYVTGSSAGGYAAQLNYSRFADAFPLAEVHALADSAQAVQPISPSYPALLATWKALVPAGCTGCSTDLTALPAWLASTYPAGRFALTAYMQDATLSAFMGYSGAGMKVATQSLLDTRYAPTANARWFAIDDTAHTMLGDLTTPSNGVTLQDWLARWYSGDPSWAGVGP